MIMAELIQWTHTEAALKEYALAAEELMKDNLLRDKRIASGELVDSISCVVVMGDRSVAVDMTLAEYWKYIEWDTRPHYPPHLPIFEWVKAKPLLPTSGVGKVRTRGRNKGIPYTQEDLQHRIAYAVQHKIGQHGTRGSHTLAKTVQQLNDTYEGIIADAVAQDFADSVDVVLRVFARSSK